MSHAALHATACIGCRRRGRKCDRTLPSCLSCENRGVACEGYVTKWPGVAARGKLAGKSIPVADSSVTITKTRSTSRVRQKHIKQNASAQDYSDGHNASSSRFTFISDEVDEFVQHYIADLSSIFFLGNGPSENPMFHYVLPLVNTVPPIRFALAGSASCHIAARNSDEALEQKSLRLRVHATHLLCEILQNPTTATDQVILASILMLAQLDMCSGDCTEFQMHLKAAATVIRNQDYEGAANKYYFEQRLAWLDIMSSTTSTQQPNLTLEEVKMVIGRFSTNGQRQWSYDVFPCPIDLFEIIIETTFLFKGQGRPNPDALQPNVTHLRDKLVEWKCPFMSGARKHMVEAWRLGIMAYIQRLFPHSSSQAEAKHLSSQVLDLAEHIPPTSSWSYALLWPIFQVAVKLDDDAVDEKETIRKRLRIALETIGCRHHSNALEVLEIIWGRREAFGPSTISNPGRPIMLV